MAELRANCLTTSPTQFTASMWTPEEAQQIVSIAKAVVPSLKTLSLPQGLQVEKGPEGVLEYVKAHLPGILER